MIYVNDNSCGRHVLLMYVHRRQGTRDQARSSLTVAAWEVQPIGDWLHQDTSDEGVWTPLTITGSAPYLPEGHGGTPEVAATT